MKKFNFTIRNTKERNFMNTPKSIFSYVLCFSLLISLVLHAFGQNDFLELGGRAASSIKENVKKECINVKKVIIGNNKQGFGKISCNSMY